MLRHAHQGAANRQPARVRPVAGPQAFPTRAHENRQTSQVPQIVAANGKCLRTNLAHQHVCAALQL